MFLLTGDRKRKGPKEENSAGTDANWTASARPNGKRYVSWLAGRVPLNYLPDSGVAGRYK